MLGSLEKPTKTGVQGSVTAHAPDGRGTSHFICPIAASEDQLAAAYGPDMGSNHHCCNNCVIATYGLDVNPVYRTCSTLVGYHYTPSTRSHSGGWCCIAF
uniref:Uncharacterized protein n=1 Tax=Romanomermis culicivorax TaxID=13658 RepID=A0A915KZH1_ROMCU